MRALPGGSRSTRKIRTTAKSTATAPPPIARSTLESINYTLISFLPGSLARSRLGLGDGSTGVRSAHGRTGRCARRIAHDPPAGARRTSGAVGAVEALVADR